MPLGDARRKIAGECVSFLCYELGDDEEAFPALIEPSKLCEHALLPTSYLL